MARHKRYQPDEETEPALDISSLIDVCFLLLIYFLVTSTINPKESDLGMALPSPMSTESRPPIDPMFIKVEASGAIYSGAGNSQMPLDSDVTDRTVPLLATQLKTYADSARASGDTPLVQIWVDGGAMQQRVIDVLNSLAGAGISQVTFTDLVDP